MEGGLMEEMRQIGAMRKRLGMTQSQLARASGVSQSLIAKIESGNTDAAYSKVKAILEVLDRKKLSGEKTAGDIMYSDLQTALASETLHAVSSRMRKHSISQMPVLEGKQPVGSISDQIILAQFSENPKKISSLKVGEVMGEAFPSIPPATPISAAAALLRHHPAVLVIEKSKITGIITKADLLKTI